MVYGWPPSRIVAGNGRNGSGASTYIHLISMALRTSLSASKPPLLPSARQPVTWNGAAQESAAPVWPYSRSSSRPSTALARPTSPMMSNRPRVRPYASFSDRVMSKSAWVIDWLRLKL